MGFRDLQRYAAQKARFEKYQAWLAMTPDQRQSAYAAITDEAKRSKPERDTGFVSPFGTAGSTKIYIPANILSATQTGQGSDVANTLRGLLANYTLTATEFGNLTGDPIQVTAKGFKFARLSLKEVIPSTTKSTSRITGAKYNKPDVDTVSSPFGQNTGGQAYDAAILAIAGESAFTAFVAGNNGKNTYKFTPEG